MICMYCILQLPFCPSAWVDQRKLLCYKLVITQWCCSCHPEVAMYVSLYTCSTKSTHTCIMIVKTQNNNYTKLYTFQQFFCQGEEPSYLLWLLWRWCHLNCAPQARQCFGYLVLSSPFYLLLLTPHIPYKLESSDGLYFPKYQNFV